MRSTWLADAARALQVSQRRFLQNLLLERQVGHQPFQPRVLALQILHPRGLVEFETAVFLPPALVRLLRDVGVLAVQRRDIAGTRQRLLPCKGLSNRPAQKKPSGHWYLLRCSKPRLEMRGGARITP
mgnify:CR=1 FL=1